MIGTGETRLVVLRGNSGSGKTTVGRAIQARRPRGEVALVSQDAVRRELLNARDVAGNPAIELIDLIARFALERAISVVVDGILVPERYGGLLTALVHEHRGRSACYLWDLDFDETLRRHASKPKAAEFGEVEMRTWWCGFDPVPGLDERVIGEAESVEQVVDRILADCGW